MGLLVKEKEVVIPGENLAEGMDYLPGQDTYREGEKIFASKLGLVAVEGRAIKLIPLKGAYIPRKGDTVIGKVIDVMMSGWRVDINCAYSAVLPLKDATSDYIAKGADLTQYFNFGEYIVTTITNVTTQNLIDLSMKGPGLRKLGAGRIVKVNAYKVPRIIGKRGSMVSMIKMATGCSVSVGQNGIILVQGEEPKMEQLAVETIKDIEAQAHLSGLTDKIKEQLEKATGKKVA